MYPSTITSFSYPSPSDRLNNPSHSSLENNQSSTIGQMQAVIGLDGGANASALGTIIGDLRNPNSSGGGHIQTASKGGTGQTTYTKGDFLVAQSSSVLTKFAVSSTSGEVLTADPNQAAGMKWSPALSNKVAINTTSVSTALGAASGITVLYSASITGSIIGNSNGIKFTGAVRQFDQSDNFNLVVNYGVNSVVNLQVVPQGSVIGAQGLITGYIVGNGMSSQIGYISMNVGVNSGPTNISGKMIGIGLLQGNSSVNAFANQDLIITGQYGGVSSKNSILTGLFVVEKIA